MKSLIFITKILVFLLVIQTTFRSNAQEGKVTLTKDEVINRAWEAMFGKLKSADIQSIYYEAYFHGSNVPNKVYVKRPNLFRNEVSSGVLVFDGKQAAWVKRNPDKNGNPRNPEMIDTASWKHFEVDIALAFPAFFDYPSELKGIAKLKERSAYELYVELPMGGKVSYFVDTESFLVVRRLVSWSGDPSEELWENLIDNYINYNGVLFPDGYSYMGRDGMEKGYFKDFKMNINPTDELFQIPDELK